MSFLFFTKTVFKIYNYRGFTWKQHFWKFMHYDINDLVQDCSISIAKALVGGELSEPMLVRC